MTLLLLLAACSPPSPPAEPVFVRDGVMLEHPVDGARPLPDHRWLLDRAWSPGERVTLGNEALVAPRRAECVPLFHVGLGTVDRRVAADGAAPDTALAFSPDGERLAVGSYLGDLLVLDAWSGEVLARRHLSESMVKQVAWSPDGQVLYAAEQSPDAFVHALDPETLASRWSVRLADRVGTSTPPPADDLYGVYTLPGAYGLGVLPDGSVLVAAVHAWDVGEGERRNASQILRIGPDGAVLAAWPEQPASVTLMHPRVGGDRVAVPVGRSATGPAPDGLPVGGVQVLSLPDLRPAAAETYEPLKPWYSEVFVWEALDVDAGSLLVGTEDGRLFRHDLDSGDRAERDLGTPVLAGDVPVAANIGHAALVGGEAVVVTAASSIPWGAADPSLRPPAPHPDENAVHVLDAHLDPVWTWRGPQVLQGLTVGPEGRTLVVGAGRRTSDDRRDLFGALVFRLDGEGSGDEHLQAFCATAAPAFFRQAVTADGRVAVVEVPWADPSGRVHGDYRVTVLR
jgi:hypothetical protein